ncbi:MAG: triose-phosphate isomerase [Spirochaeta sp. LUC14_002_19_P3]|nr:MAG: triose-phosphate isomerase [Spirochaeta sp. LUC14_002_19_P3]
MERSYLIAGNWKMNKTPSEARVLAAAVTKMKCGANTRKMIAPSFVCLPAAAEAIKGSDVILAAQNMAAFESGAHTGETSVLMLKELGVRAVILGHSERRHVYGERDALINEKVKLALAHGLDVILCIGETLKEREQGRVNDVCFGQLEGGLAGVSMEQMARVVIAYEPVWAIGTGKTATPEDAQAVHAACRGKLAALYSKKIAECTLIQYGGSVKPDNAAQLMAQPDIDGALVGGAALDAESFAGIAGFNI